MMQFEGVQAANESRGIVSVNGALYYLGRVRKTRASPDRWETAMVVFDSDPEDYMWVSPWEIVEAPEEYHDPVHLAPEPVDIWKSLTPEDMAHHLAVQSHRAVDWDGRRAIIEKISTSFARKPSVTATCRSPPCFAARA